MEAEKAKDEANKALAAYNGLVHVEEHLELVKRRDNEDYAKHIAVAFKSIDTLVPRFLESFTSLCRVTLPSLVSSVDCSAEEGAKIQLRPLKS